MTAVQLERELSRLGNPAHAKVLAGFFKTGPGDYGEGDVFIGIRVPVIRKLARSHRTLAVSEAARLLQSKVHEARLLALVLLTDKMAKADEPTRKQIYEIYSANTHRINNWDLVDVSAPHIVGAYLFDKSRRPLIKLARSKSLWERRISTLATFHFIRQNDFDDALEIAALLLNDAEDLIHKAVGWMLREVGKRNLALEEAFLRQHHATMPRTMLRYAIERFPETKRKSYLAGKH